MMPRAGVTERECAAVQPQLSAGCVLRWQEPLAPRTTFRVGGPAEWYAEPETENDVAVLLRFRREHGLDLTVLGRGSNLLVRDGGIRGLVLGLSSRGFSQINRVGLLLDCGAAARLKAVAIAARRQGLGGVEFLEGIPGTVGGGLRMNAGAMGRWMFDVVERVRLMSWDGEILERAGHELGAAYRSCDFLRGHLALRAWLRGEPAEEPAIRERMEAYSRRRWETQPPQPSAGCIFKNPPGIPAGRLIDELGLKGTARGGAMVSDVHGNFIVNTGGARAADVLGLIDLIRQRAREERGIELETEVQIVGEA